MFKAFVCDCLYMWFKTAYRALYLLTFSKLKVAGVVSRGTCNISVSVFCFTYNFCVCVSRFMCNNFWQTKNGLKCRFTCNFFIF